VGKDEHSGGGKARAKASKASRGSDTIPRIKRPPPLSPVEPTFDERPGIEHEGLDHKSAPGRPPPMLRSQNEGQSTPLTTKTRSKSSTKETPSSLSSQAPSREKRPPPARDLATGPVYIGAPPSVLDHLAIELENVLGAFRRSWKNAPSGDKLAVLSFFGMTCGVLMPWVSTESSTFTLGIFRGGVIHLLIALKALNLVTKSGLTFGKNVSLKSKRFKKGAVYMVLLGLLSSVVGIFFLLYFSIERSEQNPVNVHFGLYWTLVFGCALSYAGYLRLKNSSYA